MVKWFLLALMVGCGGQAMTAETSSPGICDPMHMARDWIHEPGCVSSSTNVNAIDCPQPDGSTWTRFDATGAIRHWRLDDDGQMVVLCDWHP